MSDEGQPGRGPAGETMRPTAKADCRWYWAQGGVNQRFELARDWLTYWPRVMHQTWMLITYLLQSCRLRVASATCDFAKHPELTPDYTRDDTMLNLQVGNFLVTRQQPGRGGHGRDVFMHLGLSTKQDVSAPSWMQSFTRFQPGAWAATSFSSRRRILDVLGLYAGVHVGGNSYAKHETAGAGAHQASSLSNLAPQGPMRRAL